ncbi:MAG: disulfide formation protein [Chlamydiales bacterium]|nr:disulfide formation protein [Chlamydiales bacterium]MCH9622817.1 disulfide formation protein [Chlamydiales bacterium]
MRKYGLYYTWFIATFASIISLYFSEIRHFTPCHLCWYQRICLFPLTIILGIACVRGFLGIAIYVLPQVIIGFILSVYQTAIQEIPNWHPIDMCGSGPSCTERIVAFGPVTIPMLASLAFLLLGFFLFYLLAIKEKT